MSVHVKDALFISLSVWVHKCDLTINGFSTQLVAVVFCTWCSIFRCSQINVPFAVCLTRIKILTKSEPSLAETLFRLKSPEIIYLHTYIGPIIGPLLALLQCQAWRLWSSATKTRCLKQSATAPACVSCTCQLVWFLHASKNGSWTIDWAFSMGLFFHGPPPLGHILRTFNPSRSGRNSFLWGHQRLLEVARSKQALENITPSWLPFPPVKVPILQGRL